jgi:hypothetical protein
LSPMIKMDVVGQIGLPPRMIDREGEDGPDKTPATAE